MQLSLCMIVKDEEYFLGKHLPQLRASIDEIVIVDTGSNDRTLEIAASYADKLLHYEWTGDFSQARNVSLEAASGEWTLVLDADEIISSEDLLRLREVITRGDSNAYTLPRYNYSNNLLEPGWQQAKNSSLPSMEFEGYTTHHIVRLIRTDAGWIYRGKVHELLEPIEPGSTSARIDIPIHHYEDGNPERPRLSKQKAYLDLIEAELAGEPSGEILELAGRAYMYHENKLNEAISCFRRCLAQEYEPERNQQNLAEALYRIGEFTEARELYEQLFNSGYRSFSVCLNLANLRVRAGESYIALECLELAIVQCEPESDLHHNIEKNLNYLKTKITRSP